MLISKETCAGIPLYYFHKAEIYPQLFYQASIQKEFSMPRTIKARAINEATRPSMWSGDVCPHVEMRHLNDRAIAAGRRLFIQGHPDLAKEVAAENDEQFLTQLGVLRRGKITNAGVLLFGKPESDAFLAPATARICLRRKNSSGKTEHLRFGCPLILSAQDVINCLPLESYDRPSLVEALTNAIAHQEYLEGHGIDITETDHDISIRNAGVFEVPPKAYALRLTQAVNCLRNPALVRLLIGLSSMSSVERGIAVSYLHHLDQGLPPPSYKTKNGFVKVTLHSANGLHRACTTVHQRNL